MMSPIQTVSPLSIVFMCVTLLICFGVPIGLAIWGKVKYKKAFSFAPLGLGIAGFVVSQIIFRQLFLGSILSMFDWYKAFVGDGTGWAFLIYSCFLAGLVEEPARFAAFSILKKRHNYPDGLSYGIGHGGIEAILMTGFVFVNNIVFSLMINTGSLASLGNAIPESVVTNMIQLPPATFLLGGVERIFAILLHIALSLFLLKGFQTGSKWLRLPAAIILHGCANLLAVGTSRLAGAWSSEGVLFVIGVISLLYIIKQARNWRKDQTLLQQQTIPAAE